MYSGGFTNLEQAIELCTGELSPVMDAQKDFVTVGCPLERLDSASSGPHVYV